MEKIGLLGGTSYPSTIPYYDYLNREVQRREGGYHTARLVLHNVDYHPIKSRYLEPNGWDEIPGLLLEELEELAEADPACIVVCNNTLHKAVDILEEEGMLSHLPPIIHIVDAVGAKALSEDFNRLLLLGTKFTMEDGFYAERLRTKFGLSVDVPEEEDRNLIQAMQTEIAAGNIEDEFSWCFSDILRKYPAYDAVVLACTEIPLVVNEESTNTPIIDPIKEQCDRALDFAYEM